MNAKERIALNTGQEIADDIGAELERILTREIRARKPRASVAHRNRIMAAAYSALAVACEDESNDRAE